MTFQTFQISELFKTLWPIDMFFKSFFVFLNYATWLALISLSSILLSKVDSSLSSSCSVLSWDLLVVKEVHSLLPWYAKRHCCATTRALKTPRSEGTIWTFLNEAMVNAKIFPNLKITHGIYDTMILVWVTCN